MSHEEIVLRYFGPFLGIMIPIAMAFVIALIRAGLPNLFEFISSIRTYRQRNIKEASRAEGLSEQEKEILCDQSKIEHFKLSTGINTTSHRRQLMLIKYNEVKDEFSLQNFVLASKYFLFEKENMTINFKSAKFDKLLFLSFIVIVYSLLFLFFGLPFLLILAGAKVSGGQLMIYTFSLYTLLILFTVLAAKPYQQSSFAIKLQKTFDQKQVENRNIEKKEHNAVS